MVLDISKIALHLRDWHVLCENPGYFECFQHFIFKINILKNENLFHKTGVPVFWLKS